eukprot:3131790-Rhodomonas_salina.1
MSAASPGTAAPGATGRGNTLLAASTVWPRWAMMGTWSRGTARLRLGVVVEAEGLQAEDKAASRPVTAPSAASNVETG